MRELEIKKRSSGQDVREYSYRFFKENIIKLKLPPGESMSEADAAFMLDISRTPVHDTFSRLADEYLLTVCPQKATTVSKIDPARVEQAVFMQRTLGGAVVRQFAREEIPEEQIFALESNLNQQFFCLGRNKPDHLFMLDQEFHQIFYQLTGMEDLWTTLGYIGSDLWRVCFLSENGELNWSMQCEEHGRLLHMIRDGKYDKACQVLDNHMEFVLRELPLLQKKHPDYFVNTDNTSPS